MDGKGRCWEEVVPPRGFWFDLARKLMLGPLYFFGFHLISDTCNLV